MLDKKTEKSFHNRIHIFSTNAHICSQEKTTWSINYKRLTSHKLSSLTTMKIRNQQYTEIREIHKWKLNNTLLFNQWVNEEITRKVRNYFERNEKENTT